MLDVRPAREVEVVNLGLFDSPEKALTEFCAMDFAADMVLMGHGGETADCTAVPLPRDGVDPRMEVE
jgi:hypothetical protein